MIAIKAARVLDGKSDCILENVTVLVDGTRIVAAEPCEVPDGAVVIDLPDCTLLPGLVDLHVHLGFYEREPDPDRYDAASVALLALRNARQALSMGVTTLRDVGSPYGVASALEQARRRGHVTAPRVVASGLPLGITGAGDRAVGGRSQVRKVTGATEMRAAIRDQYNQGVDFIKVLGNHGYTLEFTKEELAAAVDESHRLGKRIAMHAFLRQAIEWAIELGVDTVEHGAFMTPELAAEAARKGVTWVPTIVAYRAIAVRAREIQEGIRPAGSPFEARLCAHVEKWDDLWATYKRGFPQTLREGLQIATGTDTVLPGAPFSPVCQEIAIVTELGMSPFEAIRAGTSNAARAMGLDSIIGTIEPGKVGDLVAVSGNPITNISDLESVRLVLFGGEVVFKDNNTPAFWPRPIKA
jgi:imidazolonepropionase-like amidohydrolase